MYIFKKITTIGLIAVLLFSCKARQYGFHPNAFITEEFRKNIDEYASAKKNIDSSLKGKVTDMWIYKAKIEEKLVVENDVSEYKLMNVKSKKKRVDVDVKGYYHEMYLYLFNTTNEQQYGVFVSAGYKPGGVCIGVGPAYIGNVESGKGDSTFTTAWELKLQKCADSVKMLNRKAEEIELQFFADAPMMSPDHKTITFYQIIQKSGNKIGGIGKMLVYDVDKVFNDPDALVFEFVNKISYDSNGNAIHP
ncbi:MAG: hypothetical protein QM802_03480 [Agriterribacter sp.]